MILHLQSSLENKEYEAAANFVDTLAKLYNFMPHKEDITASDSENAQFVRVRDAVARVVREELHTAASKSDVSQVRMRLFQVQRRFLLVHRGTHFAKIIYKLHRS